MATGSQPLANQEAQPRQQRLRSPNYPGIDLETAVARARALYEHERRGTVNARVAVQHWGYSEKSSGGQVVLAALKAFGLTDETGEGAARTIRLSDLALRILLDTRPTSTDRQEALRRAALNPRIHSEVWTALNGNLGSEENLRHRLIFDWRFNENVVDSFIREFRATLEFAHVAEDANISHGDEESDESSLKVGDYVQWESQGILQFDEPRRIREVSQDGEWAFVEGSNTGIPMKQLTVADPSANPPPASPSGSPPTPRVVVEEKPRLTPPPPGTRQDVFSLAEGPVTIQWPASLGPDSFEDLAAWLDILKRKIGRSVREKSDAKDSQDS